MLQLSSQLEESASTVTCIFVIQKYIQGISLIIIISLRKKGTETVLLGALFDCPYREAPLGVLFQCHSDPWALFHKHEYIRSGRIRNIRRMGHGIGVNLPINYWAKIERYPDLSLLIIIE